MTDKTDKTEIEREANVQHGKWLGRSEAVTEAYQGLTQILRDKKYVSGPNGGLYVNADAVHAMLGEIRPK